MVVVLHPRLHVLVVGCGGVAAPSVTETEVQSEPTAVPPTEAPPEPEPIVLNIGPNLDAKGMSPDMTNFWSVFGVVENLTTLDTEGVLVPALATEWKMTGDKTWEPIDALHDLSFVRIEFSTPDHTERSKLGTRFLDGNRHSIASTDLGRVANEFRFSGGQIPDAAAIAGHP